MTGLESHTIFQLPSQEPARIAALRGRWALRIKMINANGGDGDYYRGLRHALEDCIADLEKGVTE